jgi:hypothetical protein
VKEKDVPSPVVTAFHKIFPAITDYDWSMEDGNYESEYEANKVESSATFDANGNLLETEKEMDVKNLQTVITDYIAKNYSGAEIKEASEITDSNGVKTYEAEIKRKDLLFDTSGKFLKEETD